MLFWLPALNTLFSDVDSVFLSLIASLDQFTGGYLMQYWAATSGPNWLRKIVKEREEVFVIKVRF